MVLDREFRYVAANAAYLETTVSRLEDLLGRPLFDAFPHDPEDPANKPAQMLRGSLEKVLRTRRPDVIAVIPYRVARTPGGPLDERLWSARHTPILDEHGEVAFIVQETADVTEVRRLEHEAELRKRALAVQESRHALDVEISWRSSPTRSRWRRRCSSRSGTTSPSTCRTRRSSSTVTGYASAK